MKSNIPKYQYILDTVEDYCNRLNKPVPPIIISYTRTRTGQYDGSHLQFSSIALTACKIDEINYLIAHECCHLVHPTHSIHFFKCLELFYPNWIQLHDQLHVNFRYQLGLDLSNPNFKRPKTEYILKSTSKPKKNKPKQITQKQTKQIIQTQPFIITIYEWFLKQIIQIFQFFIL